LLSGTHSDGIYRTVNNGKNWTKIGTNNNNDTLSNAIVFALLNPAPDIILAGTAGFGLYRSADNGKTWKHITAGLPFTKFGKYETDNALVKSGANVLLATTTGIYYSNNNGMSWHASNLTGDRIDATAIAANGDIAVAGVSEGVFPFQSGMYRSTNNGVTWSFATGTVLDVVSLASDSSKTFYAGTFSDNWRSTNNGISWTQIGSGIPSGNGGYVIKVIDSSNVFIGNSKGIYFSNNSGDSFINVSNGLNPAPNKSVQGLAANSSFLFAGLFKNGVWKRPLSDFGIIPVVDKKDYNINQQKVLDLNYKNDIAVYPVPAKDKVTVLCKINKAGEVHLSIVDAAGKTIMQSNEAALIGVYTKTIQIDDFAPGVYMVKLIINGVVNSGKMVIVK